ncbi:MAG: pyridoxal 5'-phosphate synthase glutaminase subunit PdxT [Thermoplasmataceae archaeon]
MKIGVLGFQGDVQEHVNALERVFSSREGSIVQIRKSGDLDGLSGLIIPGGESTTIFKLIKMYDIYDKIVRLAKKGMAVMGTCAGLIIISRETNDDRVKGMGIIDVEIMRNAYGRQIDSFIEVVDIKGIGKFPAVFIRAPIIERAGNSDIMAVYGGRPIMVRGENILGLTFHPELTEDLRIHDYFVSMAERGGVPVEL